ncbi:MAG: hypothetical protein UY63_C0008G0044 [Parcubacteria group bacterium GW2011_GWA2_51_10]|nr:MAG: hypothetical protein UY63_C0008G0044 [Parcubacteria group bacterium GW2011_GWA2_51_10]
MRTAFIRTLSALAEKDKNVWLVTGDLGFSVFENFIRRFPKQYLNVGVAEQNLIGVSAGLALSGKRPFAYSISTFASMRAYEQIRNDLCYQDLPVAIIAGGSSFSYSTFGCTHFPMEDFAIMRALPNMTVISPGDPLEVEALLKGMNKLRGPSYMRIAKKGEPTVHTTKSSIALGKVALLESGEDAAIIATGRILPSAQMAAEILKGRGIRASVVSCHTLKPLDARGLLAALKGKKVIATCEEHHEIGGLGGAVSELIAKNGITSRFLSIAIPDEFPSGVGSQEYFLERYHLTPEGISRKVEKAFRAK